MNHLIDEPFDSVTDFDYIDRPKKNVIRYDKLVRDNIPSIIRESGKGTTITKIKDEDMVEFLINKMDEELTELVNAVKGNLNIVDELVDLSTVLDSLISRLDHNSIFNQIKERKSSTNGVFDHNLFLVEVYD